ncbi:hypothetical protein EVB39_055 [Rhizobium phage RHph_TM3_3_9]|nr:hypothetical protein EVB39_055 [Rhizobium phage RHph_TM3_3_9]QIG68576.1 hypothetical protein EVB66_055 [Rhizobium phage RHph_TM3_3_13]QIG74434.1 hypothetical protein EVC09_054 [Rhizobium phage RHph_TM3_3_10]QXV74548.1 hypothetical protein [Rhizobium phage RHEph19]
MFEVGKQYRGKRSGQIVEVIFVGDEWAVGKQINDQPSPNLIGREVLVDKIYSHMWEPYASPKVHTEEVTVWLRDDNDFWFLWGETSARPRSMIGRIRLTYTEGGKLAVEVLE